MEPSDNAFSVKILLISAKKTKSKHNSAQITSNPSAVQNNHPLKTFGASWNQNHNKGSTKLLRSWNPVSGENGTFYTPAAGVLRGDATQW